MYPTYLFRVNQRPGCLNLVGSRSWVRVRTALSTSRSHRALTVSVSRLPLAEGTTPPRVRWETAPPPLRSSRQAGVPLKPVDKHGWGTKSGASVLHMGRHRPFVPHPPLSGRERLAQRLGSSRQSTGGCIDLRAVDAARCSREAARTWSEAVRISRALRRVSAHQLNSAARAAICSAWSPANASCCACHLSRRSAALSCTTRAFPGERRAVALELAANGGRRAGRSGLRARAPGLHGRIDGPKTFDAVRCRLPSDPKRLRGGGARLSDLRREERDAASCVAWGGKESHARSTAPAGARAARSSSPPRSAPGGRRDASGAHGCGRALTAPARGSRDGSRCAAARPEPPRPPRITLAPLSVSLPVRSVARVASVVVTQFRAPIRGAQGITVVFAYDSGVRASRLVRRALFRPRVRRACPSSP